MENVTMTNKEELAAVANAMSKIQEAISHLDKAKSAASYAARKNTYSEFISQLEQFLSCDHDEAGLNAFYDNITE